MDLGVVGTATTNLALLSQDGKTVGWPGYVQVLIQYMHTRYKRARKILLSIDIFNVFIIRYKCHNINL